MDRYAAGQDEAFAQLYDLIAPRLLGYLCRQTRDQGRAEDLLQQTMLQIHRQRGRFFRGAEVMPWAFAIARRYLIDSIRRDKRQRRLEARAATVPPQIAPASDDLVQSQQMATKLEAALARLPDNQRVVFEMIKKDGLSFHEVAQILGTSINAIKLRIHRAYVRLRAAAAVGTEGEIDGTG